jgi:hypothetical protein
MNTHSLQLTGVALLGLLAVTLLLAPIHARAASATSDRDEIPTFVLERTELATGAQHTR